MKVLFMLLELLAKRNRENCFVVRWFESKSGNKTTTKRGE